MGNRWHNEGVSLVNDPQIWTLLGVFAAIMLGGMTLMTTLLMRTMTAAIDGVNGRIDGVHARIDGLSAEMNAQFDTVNVKLEHLDRDVTALSKKVFGVSDD